MRISLKNGTRILSVSCSPLQAFKSTSQLVASSRGNRNSICSCRPGRVETSTSPSVRNVLMTSSTSTSGEEIARNAGLGADFPQPIGVGTVLRTDHENHINVMTEFPHRRLPVLGGVADVSDLGSDDVVISPFKRGNDAASVVDAQRSLRHIGDRRVGRNIERLDVLFALYQDYGTVDLAERALDLRMAGVADENEHASLGDVALALVMDLGNERTGRIEYRQLTSGRLVHHAFGDAVRAEDGHRALRHLGELLDENGAFGLEAVDDELVVNDLVAHVDRRAVFLERALDNFDGAYHTGAETPRLRENDLDRPARLLFPRRHDRRPFPSGSGLGADGLRAYARTVTVMNRLRGTHLRGRGNRRGRHDSNIFPHRLAQAQPKIL